VVAVAAPHVTLIGQVPTGAERETRQDQLTLPVTPDEVGSRLGADA
jgi:hypothetical protein